MDELETNCATCRRPLVVRGAVRAAPWALRCWACLLRCDALRGHSTHVVYVA
jgi:hypothetical protein